MPILAVGNISVPNDHGTHEKKGKPQTFDHFEIILSNTYLHLTHAYIWGLTQLKKEFWDCWPKFSPLAFGLHG